MVQVKCKLWSTDESWTSCDGGKEKYIIKQNPAGEPDLVMPVLNKINVEALKKDMESPICRSTFSPQSRSWWNRCIQQMEDIQKGISDVVI
jgi:hypothetical protein